MRRKLLFCSVLLTCCSGEDTGPTSPDAGMISVDTGPAPTCPVTLTSADPTASEGGHLSFEVTAERSEAQVTISAPTDWRVADGYVEPPYGAAGMFQLTATADCGDSTDQATLDVEVRRLAWGSLAAWNPGVDGPSEREHPALFMDAGNPDRLFLFGGLTFVPRQFTVSNDVWAYDLGAETWTMVTSNDAPLISVGRVADLPGETAVLHYGGNDPQNRLPNTIYRVDYGEPTTWTEQTIIDPPAEGVTLGSWVVDPPRSRMLSLCGFGAAGPHCDVNSYDLSSGQWTNQIATGAEVPSGRYGFFLANDLANERIVLFSGGQASATGGVNPAADTWALELAEDPVRWVKLLDDGPPGRRNGCFAFDPVGQRLFVFGGTPDGRNTADGLWVLDLDRGEEAWNMVMPEGSVPIRASCSGIYDPARQRVLFGFGNTTMARYADFVTLQL